jgi:hypothetical protein
LGKEPAGEPVKKKPRIEAARSYLKSIGSAVKGILIRSEPLLMITFEYSLRSAEEEVAPHHPSSGGVPVLRNEDVLSTQLAGQDVTLPSMVGEEVAQTALPESGLALPELLTAQVETEVETRQISQPKVAAEVGDDVGSIPAEANSTVIGASNRPSVCPVVEEAEPSCSRTFFELRTNQAGPTTGFTYDTIGFFRPAQYTNMTRPHSKSAWLGRLWMQYGL